MQSPTTETKTCIIGAGPCGIISAKVLHQNGIAFDCFEKGSGIGGIWRFKNDNGMSTCYRSLHINSSKEVMQLSDFPCPPDDQMSHFPRHDEVLGWLEDYAKHFGVDDKFTLNTEVKHVEPLDDGRFRVDIIKQGQPETRTYDSVIVANGHHWDPKLAEFPGQFDGTILHSHHYVDVTDPYDFRGKKVIVLGVGNSAMDIACELSHIGQGGATGKVYLAQRSGVHVARKRLLGRDADTLAMWRSLMGKIPWWEYVVRKIVPENLRVRIGDFVFETILKIFVDSPESVGLKKPERPFHMNHPTASDEIHKALLNGDLIPKPNIARFDGKTVVFEDGSKVEADYIIMATGYNITFPFFDESFLAAKNNDLPLWHRIWRPDLPNLMFVGLFQPMCSMMPMAELQANLIARYLKGEYQLPPVEQMEEETYADHERMKSFYKPSPRHTMQLRCMKYSFDLRQEMAEGLKRAMAVQA